MTGHPNPENVCPGCGGHVPADEYKCERCREALDEWLWGEQ